MKRTIKTIILFFAFLIGAGTYTLSAQNPPSHAKAHGVKKKYKYYPTANVYFDPSSRKYTYHKDGRWTTVNSLPSSIRLNETARDFDFEGDNPWKENENHKTKYNSSSSNKSSKNKKDDDHDHDDHDSKSNKSKEKKK
jgi:hypothetical protein